VKIFGVISQIPGGIVLQYDKRLEPNVTVGLKPFFDKYDSKAWIEISKPVKPKSNEQVKRIHGHCRCIADQLNAGEGESYTTEDIKMAMKRMAVSEYGYPAGLAIDGTMQPKSLKTATVDEAMMVIDMIMDFAAAHDLWLWEVDEYGTAYKAKAKVTGGKK